MLMFDECFCCHRTPLSQQWKGWKRTNIYLHCQWIASVKFKTRCQKRAYQFRVSNVRWAPWRPLLLTHRSMPATAMQHNNSLGNQWPVWACLSGRCPPPPPSSAPSCGDGDGGVELGVFLRCGLGSTLLWSLHFFLSSPTSQSSAEGHRAAPLERVTAKETAHLSSPHRPPYGRHVASCEK